MKGITKIGFFFGVQGYGKKCVRGTRQGLYGIQYNWRATEPSN